MRVLIKGGVWKNTEDEILKAAVMKYGKNQWARVASLLSRKSAKQCKARWYEWLDPSIKKIDWSRDEEEKLLHLAKLMPNQWRTIAPIVGRTAGQCMEHYEKLLDQAQEATETGTDDPRRLRPGEIDPAPETKPARPDPIDMDDDEKEMLAEARARLANTKGKKQKRKVRERQLEDSRRLSSLQKRRELKAAGIESKIGGGNKKRKYIDYAREIPFQKVPPVGFYDVGEELHAEKTMKLDPHTHGLELSKMEGRHEKQEEERDRAKDAKRLKALFKANAPQAVMLLSAQNDPTTLRKRNALALPAPQVSDDQLEDIVKAGQASMMLPPDIVPSKSGGIGNASAALIGDYSAQFKGSLPTPLRTPIQENIVMQEARNARLLRDMAPFTGEELPELEEGSGFEGVTPRTSKLATPNTVLATPGRGPGLSGATPLLPTPGSVTSSFGGVGSEYGGRVVRDHLGLNVGSMGDSDSFSVSDYGSIHTSSSSLGKHREKLLRSNIASQLKSLPDPEFVYELSIPDIDRGDLEDGDESDPNRREDAADIAAKLTAERELAINLELQRRSTVLKRGLPRPLSLSNQCLQYLQSGTFVSGRPADEIAAEKLIHAELVKLLVHDELAYPNPAPEAAKALARRNQAFTSDDFEPIVDDYLASARDLVSREYDDWQAASSMIDDSSTIRPGSEEDIEMFRTTWDEVHKKIMYLPTRGTDGNGAFGVPENKQEILTSLMTQFAALRGRIEKESKRSSKIESKLAITTKGYIIRGQKLDMTLAEQFAAYSKACTDLLCYRQFQSNESKAMASRIAAARIDMLAAEAQEAEWQLKYANLKKRKA